uniref:Small ribosomal subunit protein uS11c n=1 Tax=Periophthalmus magnuspinnatus TaxID=409849 RepID=A0A3B4B1K3_9GOBI
MILDYVLGTIISSFFIRIGRGNRSKSEASRYDSTSGRINRRIGSRKNARRIPKGVIHVQASFNNTIVTITDVRGRVISWSSAGTCGFKGTRRGTPFAAQTAAGNAIRTVVDQGMQRAEVMIKGPGLGRDAALRAIRRSGILLSFIRDVTPMPHNGCRPPKKRRV